MTLNKKNIEDIIYSLICSYSFLIVSESFKLSFFIIIFIILFLFYRKINLLISSFTVCTSLVFTIFVWLLNCIQIIWNKTLIPLKLIIMPIGTFVFFIYFTSLSYSLLKSKNIPTRTFKITNKKLFLYSTLFMLFSWLPFWIAEYPNSLTLDCLTQFGEIFNYYLYNNNNPMILTIVFKILFTFFSYFTSDINLNIALISILFMIINAIVFSYSLSYCYKKTKNIYLYLSFLFFYSFLSINVVFSIQLSKDTTFALSMILFVIQIDKFLSNSSSKNAIYLLIVGLFFSLLRYNGYYLVLSSFIISLLFIKKKNIYKLSLIFLTLILLVTYVCYPCLNEIINYANKDFVDTNNVYNTEIYYDQNGNKLGFWIGNANIIPLQQICNYVYNDYYLTEEQKEMIEIFGPIDIIRDQYKSYVADPIMKIVSLYGKPEFHSIGKLKFFKLYFDLFTRHPFVFISAYGAMTSTYFSPVIDTGPFGVGMCDNPFGFKNIRLISDNYTETVENFYYAQYKFPIFNTLLCPGAYTFFFVFAMFYFMKKKNFSYFLSIMPIIFNILILLTVVPINGDFRYYIPMSLCLPIVLSQVLSSERNLYDNND